MSQKQRERTSCVHKFQVDGQNIGTCSICGEVRQFPWDRDDPVIVLSKGDTSTSQVSKKEEHMRHTSHHQIQERHKYYEDNKQAIIADLLSLGRAATRKKWNIPSSTMVYLEKGWLTEEQRSTVPSNPGRPKQQPHLSTSPTPSNGRLPPFPQFSDTWDPSVQLQWLEVYSELAKRETTLPHPGAPNNC
jgi:hypothetical protein